MSTTPIARVAALLIASQALGCRASPGSVAPADTAFIEEHRVELRGVRMPSGGCAFRGPPMFFPAADTARVFREHRSVSINNRTCVQVVALGYRKRRPSMDMTGITDFGETSAAAAYDSSKPIPLPPPER
jgi:hypothetical protein